MVCFGRRKMRLNIVEGLICFVGFGFVGYGIICVVVLRRKKWREGKNNKKL